LHDAGLRLTLAYPDDSPIASLERVILPDPAGPAIDMALTLHIRRDCRLPIGLHPVFRLPDSGLLIDAGPRGGMTFPGALEPGMSRLSPAVRFASLADVPLAMGGTADLRRLPLAYATEELVATDRRRGARDADLAGRRLSRPTDLGCQPFPRSDPVDLEPGPDRFPLERAASGAGPGAGLRRL
jgi:hypothetical protein